MEIKGIYVPLITPFERKSQKVDLKLLKNNIQKLNETKVTGYMPLGSNGESALITDDEAVSVIKTVVEAASPNKQVFAGVGRESAKATLDLISKVKNLKLDAVFVLTPHFFPKQMTQQALVLFYRQVAEHSPFPVILYHAPDYAGGVNLAPETVAKLAEHPNIIGIKDSSPASAASYLEFLPDGVEFPVLAGTIDKFLEALTEGAVGGVLSSANYMPEVCCKLYYLVQMGEYEAARVLHDRICRLLRKTTAPFGISGVKYAMNLMGYECGVPRIPLSEVVDGSFWDLFIEEVKSFTAK